MVAVELAMEMYVAGYDVAAFWDNGDGGDGGHEADIFSLKHDSSIFRQSSNPVGGSWTSQASSPWAKQHRV